MTKTKQSILSLVALNQANKENSSFYFWMDASSSFHFFLFEDNPCALIRLNLKFVGQGRRTKSIQIENIQDRKRRFGKLSSISQ